MPSAKPSKAKSQKARQQALDQIGEALPEMIKMALDQAKTPKGAAERRWVLRMAKLLKGEPEKAQKKVEDVEQTDEGNLESADVVLMRYAKVMSPAMVLREPAKQPEMPEVL